VPFHAAIVHMLPATATEGDVVLTCAWPEYFRHVDHIQPFSGLAEKNCTIGDIVVVVLDTRWFFLNSCPCSPLPDFHIRYFKMKFVAAILSLFLASASANTMMHEMKAIKADSPLGMKLLSQARNLADQQAFDNTWVSGYSLKFEGCHHISQWNDEAEGEEDVRIATKRLVRFRLCPSEFCDSGSGCSNGYGDYIIDMNTYLAAWFGESTDVRKSSTRQSPLVLTLFLHFLNRGQDDLPGIQMRVP
jgi:hypothetical protein